MVDRGKSAVACLRVAMHGQATAFCGRIFAWRHFGVRVAERQRRHRYGMARSAGEVFRDASGYFGLFRLISGCFGLCEKIFCAAMPVILLAEGAMIPSASCNPD